MPSRARFAARWAIVAGVVLVSTASYTVRPGDTLTGIARRNGVSVSQLAATNALRNPNRIYAGTQLRIPEAGSGAAGVHTVVAGDTLTGIASRYRVSVSALAGANGVQSNNFIRIGQRLNIPAFVPARTSSATGVPSGAVSRAAVGELLARTASRYGWSAATVKALAWQESGWNQSVVSSAGAVGIMQVLPSTGEFVSKYIVGRTLDLKDPADNVEAGVAFLNYLHKVTGGDARHTLGGYYQGLRSMENNGVYADTTRYVDNVLALRSRFA